ncbi:hypothetical protein LCGC14_2637820, partial [marine sediment metagenome]
PFATWDFSIGRTAAGDVIYLMPGHAETTTAIALDVAGVKTIGLGFGRNRPTITSTAVATDLVDVTAANCEIHNIRLVGAASACTALLDSSAAATDLVLKKCSFEQAATPVNGLTLSGARFLIEDCQFSGSADGPDVAIELEAGCDGFIIRRVDFLYPSGLDVAIIRAQNQAQLAYLIDDIFAVGLDTLLVSMASSSAGPPDGLFASGRVMMSAAVTSIEDIVAAGTTKGMAFGRVYATDATGLAGGLVPLTTAS